MTHITPKPFVAANASDVLVKLENELNITPTELHEEFHEQFEFHCRPLDHVGHLLISLDLFEQHLERCTSWDESDKESRVWNALRLELEASGIGYIDLEN